MTITPLRGKTFSPEKCFYTPSIFHLITDSTTGKTIPFLPKSPLLPHFYKSSTCRLNFLHRLCKNSFPLATCKPIYYQPTPLVTAGFEHFRKSPDILVSNFKNCLLFFFLQFHVTFSKIINVSSFGLKQETQAHIFFSSFAEPFCSDFFHIRPVPHALFNSKFIAFFLPSVEGRGKHFIAVGTGEGSLFSFTVHSSSSANTYTSGAQSILHLAILLRI